MKLNMNRIKAFSKRLAKSQRGQGMVEYILILVVVVAIVMMMKEKLKGYIGGEMFNNLTGQIDRTMNE